MEKSCKDYSSIDLDTAYVCSCYIKGYMLKCNECWRHLWNVDLPEARNSALDISLPTALAMLYSNGSNIQNFTMNVGCENAYAVAIHLKNFLE